MIKYEIDGKVPLPSAVAIPPDLLVISLAGQMSGLGFGGTGDVSIVLSW